MEPSLEMLEKLFCDKLKELLKAGKVIAVCDTSVKNDMMEAW